MAYKSNDLTRCGGVVIDKAAAVRIATSIGWEPKRPWVGLTTDDLDEIKKQVKYNFEMTTGEYAERISHLVENKLCEKNT